MRIHKLVYLSSIILLLFSCEFKSSNDNVIIHYDNKGNITNISIRSFDRSKEVDISVNEKYELTGLICKDKNHLQDQEMAFYNKGGLCWISNYIVMDSTRMLNQLYYFDENLNINDTASFFAILSNIGDSSQIVYFSNFKNKKREVFSIDSISSSLKAYHPLQNIPFSSGSHHNNSFWINRKKTNMLKLIAYTDSTSAIYEEDFFYFYTPRWRTETKFVDKEKPF